MALDTEVANGWKGNHLVKFRSVGAMTAQTIHCQIGIAQVLVLVADRMCGMLHPFVAGAAHCNGGCLFLQERVGRGVGVVASRAFALQNGLMLGGRSFLTFDGVAVATAADLYHRSLDQLWRARGMRVMAVQTTVAAGHRPVNPLGGKNFVDHLVVATAAELKTLALDSQGRGRGGILMALVAHLFRHRSMDLIVEHGLAVRAVRVVTFYTGDLGHWIAHMYGTELLARSIVTLAAQGRWIGAQEKIAALGTVRIMAGKTVCHGLVGKLLALEGVGHTLMTAETELLAATDQIVLVVGGMSVVA